MAANRQRSRIAVQVFERMIKAYKAANRMADANAAIERAKAAGKDDLADSRSSRLSRDQKRQRHSRHCFLRAD
jgi:hypothetical protein